MDVSLYLEHLTESDLTLLAGFAGFPSAAEMRSYIHANPDALGFLLQHPLVYSTLFGAGETEALLRASPFLIFAVLVHRASNDLQGTRFVQEWIGPGRRVPMFEVEGLRDFSSDPSHRLFLAELLASYTRVASGSFWVQTPRGWRRRRYSELDPLRLIELIDSLPESERPALYRRLGDLSLFLTGVFPDYAGKRYLPPIAWQRLRRVVPGADQPGIAGPDTASGPVWLLEELGRRSYRMAWRSTEGSYGYRVDLLATLADSFSDARRMLNFLTDRYLFPTREQWFPLSGE